jgi:hypothetical protein
VDWIGLPQDMGKRKSSCKCGDEPSGSIKRWENNRVATQLVAYRVVLNSIELVISICKVA